MIPDPYQFKDYCRDSWMLTSVIDLNRHCINYKLHTYSHRLLAYGNKHQALSLSRNPSGKAWCSSCNSYRLQSNYYLATYHYRVSLHGSCWLFRYSVSSHIYYLVLLSLLLTDCNCRTDTETVTTSGIATTTVTPTIVKTVTETWILPTPSAYKG